MIKKFILGLIILCTMLTVMMDTNSATTFEDKFEYTLQSGKVVITKYIGDSTQVAIPDEIEGTKKFSIGSGALLQKI